MRSTNLLIYLLTYLLTCIRATRKSEEELADAYFQRRYGGFRISHVTISIGHRGFLADKEVKTINNE